MPLLAFVSSAKAQVIDRYSIGFRVRLANSFNAATQYKLASNTQVL